jgi:hypothetical protein
MRKLIYLAVVGYVLKSLQRRIRGRVMRGLR